MWCVTFLFETGGVKLNSYFRDFPFRATEIDNNSWHSDLELFLWYSVKSQDKLPSFVNCSQNLAKRTNSRRPAFTHDRIF